MTDAQPILLVVDDEPLNRDLLRRVLFHDYEILEAEDGVEAHEVLATSAVDVLICDHIMPGASGTEVCRAARERRPDLVALLLTGYDDAPEIHEARKTGVIFEVISKPWLAPTLREAVARAVTESRRKRGG